MGVRKAKAGKANDNAPLSKRPKAFNPQTVPQRSVNHPSDDPLAESAGFATAFITTITVSI